MHQTYVAKLVTGFCVGRPTTNIEKLATLMQRIAEEVGKNAAVGVMYDDSECMLGNGKAPVRVEDPTILKVETVFSQHPEGEALLETILTTRVHFKYKQSTQCNLADGLQGQALSQPTGQRSN